MTRQEILADPHFYLMFGDMDKPFHRPECECGQCENWRRAKDRPTHQELRGPILEKEHHDIA